MLGSSGAARGRVRLFMTRGYGGLDLKVLLRTYLRRRLEWTLRGEDIKFVASFGRVAGYTCMRDDVATPELVLPLSDTAEYSYTFFPADKQYP